MADIADRGNDAADKFLTDNLNAHFAKQHSGPDRTHCIDCGEEIPHARRAAAAQAKIPCERCIACQIEHERGVNGVA